MSSPTPKPYPLLSAEQMAHVLRLTSPHSFSFNIRRMNAMYKLPINTEPSLYKLHKPNGEPESAVQRMTGFLKTLQDECDEGHELLARLLIIQSRDNERKYDKADVVSADSLAREALLDCGGRDMAQDKVTKVFEFSDLALHDLEEAKKDVLTDITDWLGDIMVYCRSEGMKFGLPIENGLEAIMGSNMTKLGPDGIPKHDANGKFLKDMSSFIPPEPALKTTLWGNASGLVSAETPKE